MLDSAVCRWLMLHVCRSDEQVHRRVHQDSGNLEDPDLPCGFVIPQDFLESPIIPPAAFLCCAAPVSPEEESAASPSQTTENTKEESRGLRTPISYVCPHQGCTFFSSSTDSFLSHVEASSPGIAEVQQGTVSRHSIKYVWETDFVAALGWFPS